MAQVFVSELGQLRERWCLAFPQALVVTDLDAIDNTSPVGSLWLDLTVVAPQNRLALVADAARLGPAVVVMVGKPDETESFTMLKAGAQGYCHVKAAPEQLREIALVVEHGGLWMPPALMQRFLAVSTRVLPPAEPQGPELNDLTARELMVAEQVARGASNREIAEALNITERTVKAHLSAVFDKLDVRDRVQLALTMNNIPTYTTIN